MCQLWKTFGLGLYGLHVNIPNLNKLFILLSLPVLDETTHDAVHAQHKTNRAYIGLVCECAVLLSLLGSTVFQSMMKECLLGVNIECLIQSNRPVSFAHIMALSISSNSENKLIEQTWQLLFSIKWSLWCVVLPLLGKWNIMLLFCTAVNKPLLFCTVVWHNARAPVLPPRHWNVCH